jgi:uncharacterized damage-inducible protein DinB
MKSYFIQLLNYDHYANLQVLDLIIKCDQPAKPVQLIAHLLAAQQVWLTRCTGRPAAGGALWPDWPAGTFEQIINDNHLGWLNFLEKLDNGDFEQLVSYKDSKGNAFENKLCDILAHLINHGTHHRAQAGQHLKLSGADLPTTDYIFYLRTLK